jgi:hypothetical protein
MALVVMDNAEFVLFADLMDNLVADMMDMADMADMILMMIYMSALLCLAMNNKDLYLEELMELEMDIVF